MGLEYFRQSCCPSQSPAKHSVTPIVFQTVGVVSARYVSIGTDERIHSVDGPSHCHTAAKHDLTFIVGETTCFLEAGNGVPVDGKTLSLLLVM